jgi:SAM-dependent methyltransferase
VGSGTGALATTILEVASPSAVVGIDPSHAYVVHARAQLPEARAHVTVGDAQTLPFVDAAFDACVSGLVLNFVERPARAVEEMTRVTRPGGTVAAYVWDYAGEMQLIRHFWDAAAAIDAASAQLDEGRRFPLASPGALARLFTEADLETVEMRPIDIETLFHDFNELWSPFLGGQGPAPAYVAALSDMRREELRDRLRRSVPAAADGRISLIARAWAVRGRRA